MSEVSNTPSVLRGNAGDEIIFCPVCGEVIVQEQPPQLVRLPDGGIAFTESLSARARRHETRARAHLYLRHRFRFWLWRKTQWNRVLGV